MHVYIYIYKIMYTYIHVYIYICNDMYIYISTYKLHLYFYIENACRKCDVGPRAALAERKRTVMST